MKRKMATSQQQLNNLRLGYNQQSNHNQSSNSQGRELLLPRDTNLLRELLQQVRNRLQDRTVEYQDSNNNRYLLYLRGPDEPIRTIQLQDTPEGWAAVPLQDLPEEPWNPESYQEHQESPASPDSTNSQVSLDSVALPEIPISPEYRPTSPESLRRLFDPTAPVFCPTTDQIRQESHKYCIGCHQGCISQELRFCLGCMIQCPHHRFLYLPRPAPTQTANQGSSILTYPFGSRAGQVTALLDQVVLPRGNLQVQLKQVELREIYQLDQPQPEQGEPLNLTCPSTRTSIPLLPYVKVEPEEPRGL